MSKTPPTQYLYAGLCVEMSEDAVITEILDELEEKGLLKGRMVSELRREVRRRFSRYTFTEGKTPTRDIIDEIIKQRLRSAA